MCCTETLFEEVNVLHWWNMTLPLGLHCQFGRPPLYSSINRGSWPRQINGFYSLDYLSRRSRVTKKFVHEVIGAETRGAERLYLDRGAWSIWGSEDSEGRSAKH